MQCPLSGLATPHAGRNLLGKVATIERIADRRITMPIDMSKGNSLASEKEACYETAASQEELYLEETEAELRAILTSDAQSPSRATAEYWQSKIEELELDWEVERFDDQCER